MSAAQPVRHLVLLLGDQLNRDASAFDDFDPTQDRLWMAEASEESTHVWSSQQRTVQFLAAMRHFAAELRAEGLPLDYTALTVDGPASSLSGLLAQALAKHRPQRVVLTWPGDHRVLQALRATVAAAGLPLDLREDRHFLCSSAAFAAHAKGRKGLRMEYFYREQRRAHRVLMDGDEPAGGTWNFDAENRNAFGPQGPGFLPQPTRFEPDAITQEVLALVRQRFANPAG